MKQVPSDRGGGEGGGSLSAGGGRESQGGIARGKQDCTDGSQVMGTQGGGRCQSRGEGGGWVLREGGGGGKWVSEQPWVVEVEVVVEVVVAVAAVVRVVDRPIDRDQCSSEGQLPSAQLSSLPT